MAHALRMAPGECFAGHTELVVEVCCSCGVMFAIPEDLKVYLLRKKEAASFYCPNGHSQHYMGKTPEQKLEEERERNARLNARLDQANASATAHRAAATRARNERDKLKVRAGAGVCPCCNRSFKQLRAHVKCKHPEFLADVRQQA